VNIYLNTNFNSLAFFQVTLCTGGNCTPFHPFACNWYGNWYGMQFPSVIHTEGSPLLFCFISLPNFLVPSRTEIMANGSLSRTGY